VVTGGDGLMTNIEKHFLERMKERSKKGKRSAEIFKQTVVRIGRGVWGQGIRV